jgi:hypothetical protein
MSEGVRKRTTLAALLLLNLNRSRKDIESNRFIVRVAASTRVRASALRLSGLRCALLIVAGISRWRDPMRRQRIQMVLLRESGMPQPSIAEAMGVSLSTVNRAHMAYDDGGLAALKSNNRFMSLVRQAESNASPIRLGSLSDQIPTGGTTAVSRKTPVAGKASDSSGTSSCCRECAMFRERCRRHYSLLMAITSRRAMRKWCQQQPGAICRGRYRELYVSDIENLC